jgi:structural maintenance of chromosome 2
VLLHLRANSLFGQAGSQYDFSKLDIGQQKDRARELEEQQRGMKKKVNPKVMNMIDTCVLDISHTRSSLLSP